MNIAPSAKRILLVLAAVLSSEIVGSILSEAVFRAYQLQPARVFEQLDNIRWWLDVGVKPLTALIIGSVIGFFERRWEWQLALVATAPLAVLHLLGRSWHAEAFAWVALYVGLAVSSAISVARWRKRRRGA